MNDHLDPIKVDEAEFLDRAALAALAGIIPSDRLMEPVIEDAAAQDITVNKAVAQSAYVFARDMLEERRKVRKEMGL